MPKLKDFLTALAKKAGMDTEGATVKDFFAALPETEVPEDVQKGIDNSLISLTDAKNNHPEIRNWYFKRNMDNIDKYVSQTVQHFEIDPETAQEIETAETTYAKLPILVRAIAELSSKKAAANSGKDKGAIQKEIDDLHKQIAAEKLNRDQDKKTYENQMTTYKINSKINQYMNSFKTIHDDLDPEVKSTVISTLLQKELQDNNAKFTFDEQGNFTLIKNDGTNYYGENHQQVTPVKFIEQTLAKTKQLKVSSPGPVNGASNNRAYQPPVNGNGQADKNPNAAVIDLNAQALKDLEAAAANSR